jgi:hypothetical protein
MSFVYTTTSPWVSILTNIVFLCQLCFFAYTNISDLLQLGLRLTSELHFSPLTNATYSALLPLNPFRKSSSESALQLEPPNYCV